MTQNYQPKVLDKGFIRKVEKGILLVSLRWGPLEVPIHALRMNYADRKFDAEVGEILVFTANLVKDTYYISSALRLSDLITFHATLTFLNENSKFGHMTVMEKHIKVFAPFSARCGDGPWHGIGACVGKAYSLKAFRQEESHGCKYIAYSVMEIVKLNGKFTEAPQPPMKKLGMPTTVQKQSDHQSVELVRNQTGVICAISTEQVVYVTSATCQATFFPASLFEPWMQLGRFVKFDGRRISDNKLSKFLGSNPEDMGSIYPYNNRLALMITLPCVLNKVHFGRCAWAWNDHIGRIFIPWTSMDTGMTSSRPTPFRTVILEIVYNGKNEDTPWVALNATFDDESESDNVFAETAQLLRTEDGWKVQSVLECQDNPSIFLVKFEGNKRHTAFAKICDWNSGEVPTAGTPIRVTVFTQERHARHALRAVLATPVDKDNRPVRVHILHSGSNIKKLPELYEQPTPKKERVIEPPVQRTPPPPPKNCWNLAKLGPPKPTPSSFLATQDFPPVVETTEKKETTVSSTAPAEAENVAVRSTQPDCRQSLSVWSGTPVEAKPEPVSFFNASTLFPSFAPSQSSSVFFPSSGEYSLSDSVNMPSVSSSAMPASISELLNTQSESSSPGLKLDSEHLEANCWNSFEPTTSDYANSFQFGFPTMDLPIYQRLVPGSEAPSVESQKPADSLDADQVLRELWRNPRFVAAFSTSDPEMYEVVRAKLNSYTDPITF